MSNGDLIAEAELNFNVLLTADKNLRYQQNLVRKRLAIVELPYNSWPRRREIDALIRSCLASVRPGQYVKVTLADPSI
jgi:hypothetical protein